jgi:hypothetical protein
MFSKLVDAVLETSETCFPIAIPVPAPRSTGRIEHLTTQCFKVSGVSMFQKQKRIKTLKLCQLET